MVMEINPSDYKILIVDDVMSNILLLKVLLKNEKFNIVTAMNGVSAIETTKKEMPDLILLDVMMPDISGYEVAQQLRALPEFTEVPIIFLTALNTTSDVVKGFKLGGNDFISKPFNKEELIIRVKHQISLVAAKRIIDEKTEELRRTIMGRDRLYSVIAHDLRSPLGSIKMVLNMLILNLPKEVVGEDMFQMLNMANQTTEDTFSLLDNLLKWTKSQIGRLKYVAQVKNVRITLDAPSQLNIRMDVDMIKTVIRNLISNALKFSNENTVISVVLKEEADRVMVSVEDHGLGIKEEDKEKVLHPEVYFTTYGTKQEEGSGLGLQLCTDFIKRNGGSLHFTSEYKKGSRFYFYIPKNYTPPEGEDVEIIY